MREKKLWGILYKDFDLEDPSFSFEKYAG